MTSKIWKYSTDYTSDAGTAINPYVVTPDFILSGRNKDTRYGSLWVYAEPTTQFSSMTVTYYLNKSDTAYKTIQVPLTADSLYPNMYIKQRINSDLFKSRFRTIGFKFSNFSKLYGFDYLFGNYKESDK